MSQNSKISTLFRNSVHITCEHKFYSQVAWVQVLTACPGNVNLNKLLHLSVSLLLIFKIEATVELEDSISGSIKKSLELLQVRDWALSSDTCCLSGIRAHTNKPSRVDGRTDDWCLFSLIGLPLHLWWIRTCGLLRNNYLLPLRVGKGIVPLVGGIQTYWSFC